MLVAIDPGRTTGIAITADNGYLIEWKTTMSMDTLVALVDDLKESVDVVVIEDFIGAGKRSKDGAFTLKLIGAVWAVCLLDELPFVVQVPQTRVPFLALAKSLAPKDIIIHGLDAYAHALAYVERNRDGVPTSIGDLPVSSG